MGECGPFYEGLPYDEICFVEIGKQHLAFEGSSTHLGGWIGIMLYAHDGTDISPPFRLAKNEAEYETLIKRLISVP